MALAGEHFEHLFVANTGKDAVQVVQMAPRIAQVDSISSPARYFPLNIPVGPSPSELAATADGRFVLSLDSIDNRIQLIDAHALARVRDAQGHIVSLQLGGPGSEPSAMLGAQKACTPSESAPTSACVGRVYVAMRALGVVAVVDVRQSLSDQSLSFKVDRSYAVGGAPLRMAIDPDEQALFMTDAQAPQLIRLPLGDAATSAPQRYELGAIGGPLTISADASFVVVGRPAMQDVLVLMGDEGPVGTAALRIQPANPVWTPTPACLQWCDKAEPAACFNAHEADRGLCVADGGLAQEPNNIYAGLYLGAVPAQIAGLGADARGRLVTASCENPPYGRAQSAYQQAVAVAQLDGTLRLVGLRDSQGEVHIELLDAGFCRAPALSRYPNQNQPLDAVLASCPNALQNTNRFACVGEASQAAEARGLVTILRGQAGGQAWGLTWEGVVVGGQPSYGGATIDAQGNLVVPAQVLQNATIAAQSPTRFGQAAQGGDVIEVLSAPQLHDVSCNQILHGNARPCQFERRIAHVVTDAAANTTTLELDRPLPRACFGGGVGFRILAGDAFVVAPLDQTGMALPSVARLYPGDTFGPGTVPGQMPAFSFTIRSDLDAATAVDACTRYDRSQPGSHPSTALNRGHLLAWSIDDPFSPQPIAERLDALSRPQGPSGSLPRGILATRSAARQLSSTSGVDYLCISYGGSNGVLVLDPYDAPSPENRDTTSRLLQ